MFSSFFALSQETYRNDLKYIQSILQNEDTTMHISANEKLDLVNYFIYSKKVLLRYAEVYSINKIIKDSDSTKYYTAEQKILDIQIILDKYFKDFPTHKEARFRRNNDIDNKNAFKLDVVRVFAYGEFLLYYERSLTNRISMEIGAGPSFNSFASHLSVWSGGFYPEDKDSYSFDKLGFSLHLSMRYYFPKNRNGLSGFYISPELIYRRNNYGYASFSKIGHEDVYTLSFNVGYQTWFKPHFGMNFYLGPGVSYSILNGYYASEKYYNQYGFIHGNHYLSNRVGSFAVYVNLGVKFIFGW